MSSVMTTPNSGPQAAWYLQQAVAALREDQPKHAAVLLSAIARSDYLSEHGRANVYWMLSQAQRELGDDVALVDSLGGFLVAATTLQPLDDVLLRVPQARADRIAAQLRVTPEYGASAARAIRASTSDDPALLADALSCGPRGDMPYVDAHTMTHRAAPRTFERHTLRCTQDGHTLTLWFDVTAD